MKTIWQKIKLLFKWIMFAFLGALSLLAASCIFRDNKSEITAAPLASNHTEKIAKAIEDNDVLNPKWRYSNYTDEMTNKISKIAVVESRNFVNLDYPYKGLQRAQLTIRRDHKSGNDIIFELKKSQLICDFSSCSVLVKFDDNKPINVGVSKPSDHSANIYFLRGYANLIAQIKKSKTMKISVVQYKQGTHVFDFNVEGLDLSK